MQRTKTAAAPTQPEPPPVAPAPAPAPEKKKKGRGNTNARHNPNIPQSRHAGVKWHANEQKWRGIVSNPLKKTAAGKTKQECTTSFPRDQEDACAAARATLQARIDGEYWAEMRRRAEADALTRGLPLGPEDAADAEEGKLYWRPNYMNNRAPFRAVRMSAGKEGERWQRACVECASMAVQAKFGAGRSLYCYAHVPSADRCPCTDGGGLRVNCQICRSKDAEASGKVAGKLLQNCAACLTTRIATNRTLCRGGNGLCALCEARDAERAREAGIAPAKGKRIEETCLEMLIPLVPHPYESKDSMTHMLGSTPNGKRKRRGEDCDTTKKRRPDLFYVLRHPETARIVACIDVEIDEDSHAHYPSDCELGRCDDLFQSMANNAQREGFTDDRAGHARRDVTHPVVFVLKLNPNAFNGQKRVPLEHRIQVLADRINEIFDLDRDELLDAVVRGDDATLVPYVELLYYHTRNAAHHLAAYEKAQREGSLFYAQTPLPD
jgi:hypothetical protein